MHYYRIKRGGGQVEPDDREIAEDLKRNPIDYDDFWLFVKKHVLWDGNGRAIKVKPGVNLNWRDN